MHRHYFAVLVALGAIIVSLSACGSATSSTSSAAYSSTPVQNVAACFATEGAEVTRERDEVSAGYEEVVAVAPDGALLKIFILEDPKEAGVQKREVNSELEELLKEGFGLGIARIASGGRMVTAVTARPRPYNPSRALSAADLPTKTDEALIANCAV